jgi:hypothetical protein
MIMSATTLETVKSIKKELRLAMNGVVSTLQRRQGLNYKINFGVEIPRLKNIAAGFTKDKELAITLWQDNIRECKMLAIYLLPEEDYTSLAEEWISTTPFTEIADQLAMNILCKLPDATTKALGWTGKPEGLFRYCGYMTLSHLIRKGNMPTKECEYRLAAGIVALKKKECGKTILNCAYNTLAGYLEREPEAAERLMAKEKENPEDLAELLELLG